VFEIETDEMHLTLHLSPTVYNNTNFLSFLAPNFIVQYWNKENDSHSVILSGEIWADEKWNFRNFRHQCTFQARVFVKINNETKNEETIDGVSLNLCNNGMVNFC